MENKIHNINSGLSTLKQAAELIQKDKNIIDKEFMDLILVKINQVINEWSEVKSFIKIENK